MTGHSTIPRHRTTATHLAHGSVYRSHGHRPVMARRLGDPPMHRVVRQPIHETIEARLQEIADSYYEMGIVNSDGEVVIPEEDIEELKYEFEGFFDENPDLIEEATGYIDYCASMDELESVPPQRPWLIRRVHVPARRSRARRSHRVVRVAKSSSGDSGDGDPEPPSRRTLAIGVRHEPRWARARAAICRGPRSARRTP